MTLASLDAWWPNSCEMWPEASNSTALFTKFPKKNTFFFEIFEKSVIVDQLNVMSKLYGGGSILTSSSGIVRSFFTYGTTKMQVSEKLPTRKLNRKKSNFDILSILWNQIVKINVVSRNGNKIVSNTYSRFH